jgi:hypothetical protein
VTSCLILTNPVLIKHRFELAILFLIKFPFGLRAAKARAPLIGALGRRISRDPLLVSFQIKNIAHQFVRFLSGAGSTKQGCGDVSTAGRRTCAACITMSAAPNLHRVRRAINAISRGGIVIMYHDVARVRQRTLHKSFGQHDYRHPFSENR